MATAARVPGAYWREVLTAEVEQRGCWSMSDLMRTVDGCDASLVDVAGWLSDELNMGRVEHVVAWPRHYQLAAGARFAPERIRR
jgi:hypothetical protein